MTYRAAFWAGDYNSNIPLHTGFSFPSTPNNGQQDVRKGRTAIQTYFCSRHTITQQSITKMEKDYLVFVYASICDRIAHKHVKATRTQLRRTFAPLRTNMHKHGTMLVRTRRSLVQHMIENLNPSFAKKRRAIQRRTSSSATRRPNNGQLKWTNSVQCLPAPSFAITVHTRTSLQPERDADVRLHRCGPTWTITVRCLPEQGDLSPSNSEHAG